MRLLPFSPAEDVMSLCCQSWMDKQMDYVKNILKNGDFVWSVLKMFHSGGEKNVFFKKNIIFI